MCRTVLAVLLVLAGCAGRQTAGVAPVSTDPNWATGRELEPANSLPSGYLTRNPIAPATGVLGTIRVP